MLCGAGEQNTHNKRFAVAVREAQEEEAHPGAMMKYAPVPLVSSTSGCVTCFLDMKDRRSGGELEYILKNVSFKLWCSYAKALIMVTLTESSFCVALADLAILNTIPLSSHFFASLSAPLL